MTGSEEARSGEASALMRKGRAVAAWVALAALIGWALADAVTSPLLAWRQPVYIAAGLAGVAGLALMLLQPLLAMGAAPGLHPRLSRRIHGWVGAGLVAAVVLHVVGLWITSPPDVVDALLFRSPTLFSPFGVAAMGALFAAALVAAFRRRRLRPKTFSRLHVGLAAVAALGVVAHALLIEGTMGAASKAALCAAVVVAVVMAAWRLVPNRRQAR